MTFSICGRVVSGIAVFCALVVGLSMQPASASQILVRPIQIKLTPQARTVSLEIQNLVDVPVRVQISVLAWKQATGGDETLTPTEDVAVFPSLLTVEKGQARTVRIGSALAGATAERAYRIVVEELPAVQTDLFKSAPGGGVPIRTKLLIPTFIVPNAPVAKAGIDGLALAHSVVKFQLTNTGTAHYTIKHASIRGMGVGGAVMFDIPAQVQLVLASSVEEINTPISAANCARLSSIVVNVETSDGPVKQELPVSAAQCR